MTCASPLVGENSKFYLYIFYSMKTNYMTIGIFSLYFSTSHSEELEKWKDTNWVFSRGDT